MNKEAIDNKYRLINKYVISGRVKDAMDILYDLVVLTKSGEIRNQYEELNDTYHNILKYTLMGIKDPDRIKVYRRLQRSILELTDFAREQSLMLTTDMITYKIKHDLEKNQNLTREEALDTVGHLVFDHELSEMLKDTGNESSAKGTQGLPTHREILKRVFNTIWLTDHFKEGDIALVTNTSNSNTIPWHEKCLIISALTLSAMRCFDFEKLKLLYNCFKSKEDQVWERALIGFFIILFMYDERLFLYPEIDILLHELAADKENELHIENILVQFLKSKETEKITRKFNEEIVPEVIKLKPKIEDRLELDNILSDEFSDDKNPDWETFFKDTPDIYEKLEEMSKLQMEGSDVFLGTFSLLKQFDFFREMINWFLPFYTENEILNETIKKENSHFDNESFLTAVSKSAFLCNSDKYSFCLNIKRLPEAHKVSMLEMFNAEIESMNEIAREDELLNKPSLTKWTITQYIQDLYRFFKLYINKHEFYDIFNTRLDFHNKSFFTKIVKNVNIIRNIAEFLFEKDYFREALECYQILEKETEGSYELFEKIAYCYQQLENFDFALKYYKQAELFGTNSAWVLKKIAYCYRRMNDNKEALRYYREVEKLEPENLFVQASIGHCYLEMEDYEKALQYYFKVELEASDNHKILRPIAWIFFLQSKLQDAKKYYERIPPDKLNSYDFMNMGHVELCLGNRKAAVESYIRSVDSEDFNLKAFLLSFEEDKKHLIKNGLPEDDIPFIIDYLKYELKKG